MMNGFKSSGEDIEVRMKLLASRLNGLSNAAIAAACDRFADGQVEGQSMRTPPTVPEFVKEAKQQQEYIDIRSRPKAVPKPIHRNGPAPFEVRQAKAREDHANWTVLHENVDLDRFKTLSRAGELSTGSTWVACLGTIFAPPTKAAE